MEIYPTTVPFLSPRDSSTSIFGNASLRNLTQPQPKLQERTKVNPSEVPYNNLSARCAFDTFTYGLLPDLAFIKDTSIIFFYSPSCQFRCNLVLSNNSKSLLPFIIDNSQNLSSLSFAIFNARVSEQIIGNSLQSCSCRFKSYP